MGQNCSCVRTIPVSVSNTTSTSSNSSPVATKEELICSNTGTNNYFTDLEYINNKIDTHFVKNTVNFNYAISDKFTLIIYENELKTNVNNFKLMNKEYVSPEYTIKFKFEITNDFVTHYKLGLVISAHIIINNSDNFVQKYWPAFVKSVNNFYSYNSSFYLTLMLKTTFNNDITANIIYDAEFKYRYYEDNSCYNRYDRTIENGVISFNNICIYKLSSSQYIGDSSMTLAEIFNLVKDIRDNSFEFGTQKYRNFSNVHFLYTNVLTKDNIKHYDRTYNTTSLKIISITSLENLYIIPYCEGCNGSSTRCGNIILYGNKIIEKLIHNLNNRKFIAKDGYNTVELIIPEINITRASISYLQEVLKKYDMNYTIHKVITFIGKISYKISLKISPIHGFLPASLPVSSTSTPVISIPTTLDLTGDLSLSSSDSVNSLSGLLTGFSTKSSVALTASTTDLMRNRPVNPLATADNKQ